MQQPINLFRHEDFSLEGLFPLTTQFQSGMADLNHHIQMQFTYSDTILNRACHLGGQAATMVLSPAHAIRSGIYTASRHVGSKSWQGIQALSQKIFQNSASKMRFIQNVEKDLYLSKTIVQSGITPERYFGSKTYAEMEEILFRKFGSPKGVGSYNKSFYNPKTKRTFNLHKDPAHRKGKAHIDIRKRGLPSDYYANKPFYLEE